MNIIPRSSLFDFSNLIDQVFHSPSLHSSINTDILVPKVDIRETNNQYLIHAELPGIDKKDIDIQIDNGTLIINAKTEKTHEEKDDGKIIRRERQYGSYQRHFFVGSEINKNDINAKFSNGVLTIKVPRPESDDAIQTTKAQTIEVD